MLSKHKLMLEKITNSPFRKLALILFCITVVVSGVFYSAKISKYQKYTLEDKQEGVKVYSINLNLAKVEEFENLPGVGPELAVKISAYRDEIEGFKNIEQIQNVKGIGRKKFEAIKGFISL